MPTKAQRSRCGHLLADGIRSIPSAFDLRKRAFVPEYLRSRCPFYHHLPMSSCVSSPYYGSHGSKLVPGLDIDLLTAAAVDVQALITGAGEDWIGKINQKA